MRDWHPRDDGFDDDDDFDPMDECGFHPPSGICLKAGSEWCDWDCPFNMTDPTT